MKEELKNIYLHLTKVCNLNCTYCYFSAGKPMKEELSFYKITNLFKDISLLEPKKIVFTGGEPLLRKDLFNLADSFHEINPGNKINLCLMSNGILIDQHIAKKIEKAFDEVRISIDGPQEINDRLRGNGSYDNAINAIKHLQNAEAFTGVSITITDLNLSKLKSFLAFLLDELFITNIHLAPFRPVGRGAKYPEFICSWRKATEIIGDFWRNRFGEAKAFKDTEKYTLINCGNCGIGSHINILPDGTVYPCHVLSVPKFFLGNVKKEMLSEIINKSKILKTLRSINFTELAKIDKDLKKVLQNTICLGEIYRDNPEFFLNHYSI